MPAPDNDPAQKRYVCGVLTRMVASGFGAWTESARNFLLFCACCKIAVVIFFAFFDTPRAPPGTSRNQKSVVMPTAEALLFKLKASRCLFTEY